jgi:hypothetical protein|tara:strand:+ start:363 stop:614 length:252 start_codon:yes stop_codon:yes gene_type:complete
MADEINWAEQPKGEVCCDNCTDEGKCGGILEILSEIIGEAVYDNCECSCDENVKRGRTRTKLHENPDIDTSAAELDAEPVEEE